MSTPADAVNAADYTRVLTKLLDRLLELEAEKPGESENLNEALRGVRANQLDARGNRGGIWYVVESKWSIVAIVIAALALGISIMGASQMTVAMMEAKREHTAAVVEATRERAREERLKINAVDDLRMEMRAVLREAGVQSEVPENTDISQLAAKAVKGAPHVPK